MNLLSIMETYDCNTIVFSSSATIYGFSNKNPINEDALIDPINPYGHTKSSIELILGDLYKSLPSKWRIANLRYFNPIGSHYSGLIGEDPLGVPNNIFPFITQVATQRIRKLNVFGDDWPTKDGTGVRDYIHVMDLADGHIQAFEFLKCDKPQVLNLNLGTGIGTSVLELINVFQIVNKISIPYIISDRRAGDVAELVANNLLAKKLINFQPKRSLEDMCRDGWKWQSLNPSGY